VPDKISKTSVLYNYIKPDFRRSRESLAVLYQDVLTTVLEQQCHFLIPFARPAV
jgi:hypothetical protein